MSDFQRPAVASVGAPDSRPADCYDAPELLPADEALRRINEAMEPVAAIEQVHLRGALGRVLASDVASPLDVPGFTNSAMDGFAVVGQDVEASEKELVELSVRGTAWAGKPFDGPVTPGTCVRIMTGAVMPAGADTVVMQEQVELCGDRVRIEPVHRAGQNVREAGEDLRRGATVLSAGHPLLAAELGLLASLGIGEVPVLRRLRVATFSTGDEIRSLGQSLEPGQIYDSNRYTLFGMLSRLGVDIVDLGVIADREDSIREAFAEAAACADVVITSGGASASEADFVAETLQDLGSVRFWRIAIRPGRPLAFGRIGDAFVFGLPGNPVAVMVTFYQFVQPALRRMMGERDARPVPMLRARVSEGLRKKPGRVEYYRAVVSRTSEGDLAVAQTGKSGSALLHTMSDANCFIVLPDASGSIEAGEWVDIQPFFGLV
ncbi:MAG: molybdopterin molybdenumtransferase MoeA [Deltaproteobacteria bacterium]|nr:molybdopterin molybdenumtransferase MoeA [Deltaproteobacteria bacterium]